MHKLPDLPYEYNALEPHIDEQTMRIHHDKHHQGYINKLNSALENFSDLQEEPVEELLANLKDVPEEVRTDIKRGGGGHYNHSLFWTSMSPEGGGEPEGDLADAIKDTFGSFQNFKEEFNNATGGVFGSGWGWLVVEDGELKIVQTKNQDNPVSNDQTPLLGLDVWEHSFYLKYQNQKNKYIESWWNLVNWNEIEKRFKQV